MTNAAPDWITTRGVPAATAPEIRDAILKDIMEVAGSRAGLYYHVAMIDGLPWYTDVLTRTDGHDLTLMSKTIGTKLTDWADVNASALTTINRFTVDQKADVQSNRFYETLWRPQQLASSVGMSAMAGDDFVGWVGAYRLDDEVPFEEPLTRALQPRVDAYVHALEVARQLEGGVGGGRALIVLDEGGEWIFESENAHEWRDAQGLTEGLRAMVGALREDGVAAPLALTGAVVRLTPVSGTTGERYMVELTPTAAWQPPQIAQLSKRKREVAEFAAAGATNVEIGHALSISPETVRTHIKQVYDTLGISTRLELAEHIRKVAR